MTAVAAQLGINHFPAQRYVLDVAGEIDDETGLLAYSTVICRLHRQFGKTVAVLFPQMTTRGLMFPGQSMTYTAQDRNHARAKFEEDFVNMIRASESLREDRDYTVRLANGSERLAFPRTKSRIVISATSSSSGHSKTLDMPAVDEAWYHADTDVDSGFRVPMITRRQIYPGAQMWIVSAAGVKGRSLYFDAKIELGREAVARDSGRGVAFFDWSCPEDWDHHDRRTWWYFLPALGHTITERDIEAELEEMDEADWLRAYGSQDKEPDEDTRDGMDMGAWARQVDVASAAVDGLVLSADGSPDRAWGSIGVAGWRSDRQLHVELVETRPGTGWVAEELVAVARRQGIRHVAIDPTSSVGSAIAEAEAAGLEVVSMGPRAHAHAAGSLHDWATEGRLWHRGQAELFEAAEAARRRPLGDAWAWDRRTSEDNLTPFVAVTLAAGAVLALAEAPDEPSVYDEQEGFWEW